MFWGHANAFSVKIKERISWRMFRVFYSVNCFLCIRRFVWAINIFITYTKSSSFSCEDSVRQHAREKKVGLNASFIRVLSFLIDYQEVNIFSKKKNYLFKGKLGFRIRRKNPWIRKSIYKKLKNLTKITKIFVIQNI